MTEPAQRLAPANLSLRDRIELAKGTGKPLLEKDIASRRPGYADYVRRTSGFVPLPPKRT